jgi:RNA polymerase sigma-70 factor (ECF subfamily)
MDATSERGDRPNTSGRGFSRPGFRVGRNNAAARSARLQGQSDAELLAEPTRATDAFGEVYERHAEAVLTYFVRRTGCAQTAADLTSETFAAALVSRRRFRDTGAPGRAWLFKIAQRQLTGFIRSEQVSMRARQKLGIGAAQVDDADIERIERLVDFSNIKPAITEAVARLPEAHAQAVALRIGDELPYREVADRLGCTEGTARVRVSRALTTLAEELGALR